jgi:hypothetical protein
MAFKDVLKKQRQSGKGLISSLGSSAFDTIREKIDYRNSLFKKGGTLNALFPNVKGFKAGEVLKVPKQAKTETEKTIVSMDNTEVVQELSKASAKLDIVGKNTMALPIMMRDMNVMRQGIVKLVKLSGGTQRDKADRFFQTSAERESLYETKIAKSKIVTPTTPTNVKQVPEEKKKGIFDSILDFLPTVFKGLLLTGIIGQLLENEETRKKVKDFVSLVLTKFFNGVSNSFEVIKESFQNEDVQKSIRTAIGSIISTIGEFLNIKLTKLFDTPFGEVNLTIGGAIAAVIAGFVAFKAAIATLTTAVLQAAGRIGMAGGGPATTGPAGGKGPNKRGGKFGAALALTAMAAPFALSLFNKKPEELTEEEIQTANEAATKKFIEKNGREPTENDLSNVQALEQSKSNIKDAALTVGVNAVGAVGSAYAVGQAVSGMSTGSKVQGYNTSAKRFTDASGKFTSAKDLPKGEMLKKFMDFAVKAQSKGWIGKLYGKLALRLGQSVAIKAAAFIGGLTVPGIGTAVALVSLASLAYDAYNIYEAIFGENGILDELEKEDKLNNVSSTPTPTSTLVTETPSSPPTAVQGRSTMKDDPRRTDKAPSNSPTSSMNYSEVVGKSESGGNYDTVFGQPGNAKINGKPVTQNTIGEVVEWQNKMRSSNKHAAGKYQFINVADAAKLAGLSPSALFDGINQEAMQMAYTERNAQTLRQKGIAPTDQNLGLAHSVGATGASKLLAAQQSGQGNAIAADVLGLTGAARETNPHLMKPVSEVIASNNNKFNNVPGQISSPGTMVAQAPSAPARPATQIASASTSLADTMRTQMQTPVVINSPTTNNNIQNGGGGGQRSTTTPSIVDSELMKLLVERVAA